MFPARFNGPPGSANGGYACGVIAQQVPSHLVEVTLRRPPPLDTTLFVERAAQQYSVHLDNGDVIAVAEPVGEPITADPAVIESPPRRRRLSPPTGTRFAPASPAGRIAHRATGFASSPNAFPGRPSWPIGGRLTSRSPTTTGRCNPRSSGRRWTALAGGRRSIGFPAASLFSVK